MSALNHQVGGMHYKSMPMQPVEFCQRNKLGTCESAAIKYICRHGQKNGAEDIKKAIHYLELLLEIVYGISNTPRSEPPEISAADRADLASAPTGVLIPCGDGR